MKKSFKMLVTVAISIFSILVLTVLFVIFQFKWKYSSFFDFLYPTKLEFYSGEGKVVYASSYSKRTAIAVKDSGVYIALHIDDESESSGIPKSERRAFKRYGGYAKIFSGKAIKVNLCDQGGTIITADGELYCFSDYYGNDYTIPSTIDISEIGKCIDAYLMYQSIFVLTDDNKVYSYDLSTATVPVLVQSNIRQICRITDSEFISISKDGEVFYYSTSVGAENTSQLHFNSDFITDVAILELVKGEPYLYGYIDGNSVAHLSYESGNTHKKATVENAVKVIAYSNGIAVLEKNGTVSFYGQEYSGKSINDGTTFANNALDIFCGSCGSGSLIIVTDDGSLKMYGMYVNRIEMYSKYLVAN